MGLFKPDWVSRNEQKAMLAVERADLDTLFKIAFGTPHREVCMAAIRRMNDESKADVVMGIDFIQGHRGVSYSIKDSWYRLHTGELSAELISQIEDHSKLAFIVKTHPEQRVREWAMHRLTDDPEYTDLILKEGSVELGRLMLSRAGDDKSLFDVAINSSNRDIRIDALRRMRDSELLAGFAAGSNCDFEEYSVALEMITDPKKLEPFLNSTDKRKIIACCRLLAVGSPEQKIMVLRDHYEDLTLRSAEGREVLVDVKAAAPRFESAVVEFMLRTICADRKNTDNHDNYERYCFFMGLLAETHILREYRNDAFCREVVVQLSDKPRQSEIQIVADLLTNLATHMKNAELEAWLRKSEDWPVKRAVVTELRQRGRISDKMLSDILRQAAYAMIHEEYCAGDFLAAFPCRECVDALLGLMQKRNANGTIDLDKTLDHLYENQYHYVYRYESRAAEIIKQFYLEGDDSLKNYLRARKPQQYSSKHYDVGSRSCNMHDDAPAVEFPEF